MSTVVEPVEAQIVEELGIRSEELGIDSVAEPVEVLDDDVVGACEHYLRALEIMELELETENLKAPKLQNFRTSKSRRLGDSATW